MWIENKRLDMSFIEKWLYVLEVQRRCLCPHCVGYCWTPLGSLNALKVIHKDEGNVHGWRCIEKEAALAARQRSALRVQGAVFRDIYNFLVGWMVASAVVLGDKHWV